MTNAMPCVNRANCQVLGRLLCCRIKALFQSDRDHHALQVGHAVMNNLGENKVKRVCKDINPAAKP